jgi:16S rRNA (cytosine967-C5)-methyltransferase
VSVQKPREIAARVLHRAGSSSEFIEKILDLELRDASLSPPDRRLCLEMVYGVTRWRATLNWLISRKTPDRPQPPLLQILLQLGLYQLFWLERIPSHAAVHEMVELAKNLGMTPSAGFVNAVLRGYDREGNETEKLIQDLRTNQPALGFSHPEWLWERWRTRWGAEDAIRLMQWNNTPPQNFARVNTLKVVPSDLQALWRREGVEFVPRNYDWTANDLVFELTSHPPLETLTSFKLGFFYVQDPSTLLAVHELDPKPGQSVLDLCSAPGGKTTYIAQRMENRGRLLAQDIQPKRLSLVRENLTRLGVTCADTAPAPSAPIKTAVRAFDRILIDAPCSNTGVIRRRVDLRWRIRREEIQRLREMQMRLIRQAAAQVKPGGALVYSTCSLEPEENRQLVQAFLIENSQWKLLRERELVPFKDGVDGAYVAKLAPRG